jgi:hypothetical protein
VSRQCWANPSPANNAYTRKGNLTTDVILVDSRSAPTSSPAPAPGGGGNPKGIVPQGWIRQIGSDEEVDTMLVDARSGTNQWRANITQFVVPYISGGWPPDPQAGQPGHTPQRPPGEG